MRLTDHQLRLCSILTWIDDDAETNLESFEAYQYGASPDRSSYTQFCRCLANNS